MTFKLLDDGRSPVRLLVEDDRIKRRSAIQEADQLVLVRVIMTVHDEDCGVLRLVVRCDRLVVGDKQLEFEDGRFDQGRCSSRL